MYYTIFVKVHKESDWNEKYFYKTKSTSTVLSRKNFYFWKNRNKKNFFLFAG